MRISTAVACRMQLRWAVRDSPMSDRQWMYRLKPTRTYTAATRLVEYVCYILVWYGELALMFHDFGLCRYVYERRLMRLYVDDDLTSLKRDRHMIANGTKIMTCELNHDARVEVMLPCSSARVTRCREPRHRSRSTIGPGSGGLAEKRPCYTLLPTSQHRYSFSTVYHLSPTAAWRIDDHSSRT